jgi:hypothetical protein
MAIKRNENLKNILPSKKFITIMSLCLGSCIVILVFASYFGSKSAFTKPALSVSGGTTVGELLIQDSNNNGLADWEETLYGLDPKGDGIANKKIIDDKKIKTRQENGITGDATGPTSQTAKLSREMLSTILALQQSGNLTPEAVANLGDTLGQTVDVQKDNPQTYTIGSMQTIDDSSNETMTEYLTNFNEILEKANNDGLGKEMAIVYQALDQNSGHDEVKKLDKYIQVYAKFAADIVALKTPKIVSQRALALANACALMSKALGKIELMYTDAVSGLIGFDEYTTAGTSINAAVPDLLSSFNIKI